MQVPSLGILSPFFSSFLCALCVKALAFDFAFRLRSISQVTIVGGTRRFYCLESVALGPFRLVAPHEKRPARWVEMLKSITVARVP
jgi:hypothetical protein